jgi:hypothetical protein
VESKKYLLSTEKEFTLEFEPCSGVKCFGSAHSFIEYPLVNKYPPYWYPISNYRSNKYGELGTFLIWN